MKYIFIIMVIFGLNLSADYVKKTMAVCDSEESVLDLIKYMNVNEASKDALKMEMWLMGNGCKIIDKKTAIEVLNYTGKKTGIIKIKLKQTGDIVFGQGKAVQIEQPGQKNIILKF